ncbi:hypothetical protein [Citreimonas salinaria]|uniref:Thiol-activated cytolysin n=1 Tax=Citreimonas salinaria TaxID=321339 RepID=A0A1H3N898_9RHOB|nr:hypothetical protein [Citreimonas salinaria]SDY84439.1 hypothetical protein SAMN05444340_1212 [Citreimonas salinaria]
MARHQFLAGAAALAATAIAVTFFISGEEQPTHNHTTQEQGAITDDTPATGNPVPPPRELVYEPVLPPGTPAEPEQAGTEEDIEAAPEELSFDDIEAEVVDRSADIDLDPENTVLGWRIKALGHQVGALPDDPAWIWNRTKLHVPDALYTENDVGAGFSDTNGIIAQWNALDIELMNPRFFVDIPSVSGSATSPEASAAALDALFASIEAGSADPVGLAPARSSGSIDISELDSSVTAIEATGVITIPPGEGGVYQFRVLTPKDPLRGPKLDEIDVRKELFQEVAAHLSIEVNGQTVFGGAAAQTRRDGWDAHIVPRDVSLAPGRYRVLMRAAPLIAFNLDELAIKYVVEYRRPGAEGWQNVAEIMESNESKDDEAVAGWSPIAGGVDVTRAGAYAEDCKLSVLPDAFVNPEASEKGSQLTLPVNACELVTLEFSYDPQEAGDHYIMPYLASSRCIVSLDYFSRSTATMERAIPSPAAGDLGLFGARTSFSDAYGHLPLTKASPVEVQVRAMCQESTEMTLFFKRPSSALMKPW